MYKFYTHVTVRDFHDHYESVHHLPGSHGFWKMIKLIFSLIPLLFIGSFSTLLSAEGNADTLVLMPMIVDYGTSAIAPVAVNDSYQMDLNQALVVSAANGVLANDLKPGQETLQATLVDGVAHGVLNLNVDGSFSYNPVTGFSGQDSFTYRADAGSTASNVATVTITVGGGSGAPVAVDDSYETAEGTALVVDAANGVLANDTYQGQGTVQATLVKSVLNGALNLNTNGSFSYTPNPGYNGQDSFTYRATAGSASSDTATAMLTVIAVDDAPVAADDSHQTPKDTTLDVDAAAGVLANDAHPNQEPLQAVLVNGVLHGVLTLNTNGSFSYTPDPGYVGQDSFTYQATDGSATSNVATVTLTMTAVNNPPVANNDGYETAVDVPLTVDTANSVLTNDTDADVEPLQAVLVSNVAHGVLNLNADGSFVYTPTSGFIGQDSFTYQASDGTALSNIATVMISVTSPLNDPPYFVTAEIGFSRRIIGKQVREAHAVVVADLDRDGDLDIAATDYRNGRVVWYQNDGNGNFQELTLDAKLAGAYPAGLCDVNQDGHTDVLAAGYLADTFVWYRNDGGGKFARRVIDSASDGAHSIVCVDLDEDGDIDFVTSSQDAATIAWYENNGSLAFTRHILDNNAIAAKRAEVADLDGDGDLDIATASHDDNTVAWLENDGNQNFTKHIIDDQRMGAYYASPADIDGQGNLDLFTASKEDDTIAWYRNTGSGFVLGGILDDETDGARSAIPADIDGDGDLDAVATGRENHTIAWHENDGSGNFTKHMIDIAATGAYGVFTIDMNGDGDLDVLSAQRVANTVHLYTQVVAHKATVVVSGTMAINSDVLLTEDVDDGPAELTYTLTQLPEHGELRLNGVALPLGGTFTQEDVNNGRLTYVHMSVFLPPDEFRFTVADGGEDGVLPLEGIFLIFVKR